MNMNNTMSGSNNSSSELVMMTPYLHFTGGDHLFFKSWHPSSQGAIAGASIALLILAVSDRYLHAIRGVMDARWRKRYGFATSWLI
jgi:copper transporter 1